jgi:hypothetical protein
MTEIGDLSPDVTFYKQSIAKAILYRQVETIVRRSQIAAFQANVVAYLVAYLSKNKTIGLDLDDIWMKQDLTSALKEQIRTLVPKIDKALQGSAKGKMVSEWAKRPECWDELSKANLG